MDQDRDDSRNAIRRVAVVDIGKTNAKLAVVDLPSQSEIAVRKTPNTVLVQGPYPHYDAEGLWAFIREGLRAFARDPGIDAVSVATHGASAALVAADGSLALPALDYEFDGPDALAADYDAVRPDFSESGSPRLPAGLNLGAQIFWQARSFPDAFARVRSILAWPQYWSFRLTGVLASEPTSLGAHTDLWNPQRKDFSSLVDREGWRSLMPPLRRAGDRLGVLRADLAAELNLRPETPVACGIHDSNASLYPHLIGRTPPFSVVSTGTWVIVLSVGGALDRLDSARDCLINVDAMGEPVPSARFMGGREFSILTQGVEGGWSEADLAAVLDERIFALPTVQDGARPFQGRRAEWIARRAITGGERHVAASFYLALMTATCLELVGAAGETIVEGPMAGNELFLRMLGVATGRPVVTAGGASTGASVGAALLLAPRPLADAYRPVDLAQTDDRWRSYAAGWRAAAEKPAGQGRPV